MSVVRVANDEGRPTQEWWDLAAQISLELEWIKLQQERKSPRS